MAGMPPQMTPGPPVSRPIAFAPGHGPGQAPGPGTAGLAPPNYTPVGPGMIATPGIQSNNVHLPGAIGQPPAQQSLPPGATNSNPLQPFYLPNPVQGQATLFQGAQSNFNASPAEAIQQILMGFAPQAAQSTNALNNTLAAMGVVGGGATDAQTALQGQLAASLAPTLANAIQTSQGMGLQQALQNAGFLQQAGLANQSASNQFNMQNMQNWNQQQGYNTNLANQAQNELAQALMNAYGMNFNAFNNLNNAGLQGALNLASQGLSNAGNLASSEANNFPVYQSQLPGLLSTGAQIASLFAG